MCICKTKYRLDKIIASKERPFNGIEIFVGWFAKKKNRGARGTNHEPGSGSAFINYYLSVNTVCGTFVRDLSHTRMQHVRDRDSNGILAIISHPFDTYHAHSQPPVARVREGQHVFIIVRIDCRYREYVDDTVGPAWHLICTYLYSCISRKLPRSFPICVRLNHFLRVSCRNQDLKFQQPYIISFFRKILFGDYYIWNINRIFYLWLITRCNFKTSLLRPKTYKYLGFFYICECMKK